MKHSAPFARLYASCVVMVCIISAMGCGVGIPSKAVVKVERSQEITIEDNTVISISPRRLLEGITEAIEASYKNIEVVDGLLFRDTAYAEGGWRLKKLLIPEHSRRLVEQLNVDYLVVAGPIKVSHGETKGFMVPMLLGALSAEGVSTIAAMIIDLRTGEVVSRLVAEARGTTHIYHYVIIVAGNEPQTDSGAIEGLAKEIGKVITGLTGSGTVRIAVLGLEDFELSTDPDDWGSSEPVFKNELAFEILRERAAEGEHDAQWLLYQIQPDTENMAWLCRDADQGSARARSELGNLYFYGSDKYRKTMSIHVSADISRSCMWFHLAGQADITWQTETDVNKQTPVPYESPEVERTSRAMTAAELAEAKQLIEAWKPGQCDLDFSRLMIIDYANDPALARICIAADNGDYSARDDLGRIYFLGSRGVKVDLTRSYMWYSLAADVRVTHGQKGGYMQTICDTMTPEQRASSLQLLEAWKPGECEKDLFQ